jgi:hypothetical protein
MHGCFPSKILLFYRKHNPVVDIMTGAVTSSGIHAIIHSCKYREGTSTKRTKKFHETRLCSRCNKICMMTTRLACNRAIESSYWRMDNDPDVGLLTGYVLYQLPVELEFMDLDTFPH